MGTVIEIDTSELEEFMEAYSLLPTQVKRSLADSLNRTSSKVITWTGEAVQKEYNSIKRKDIKGVAKIKRANSNNLDSSITFTDSRLKASLFPHTISRRKNRSPVTLKIKKAPATSGGNPIMFGEGTGQRRGARGTREVYKRYPNSREVKTVHTIAIPQMVENQAVFDEIQELAEKFLLERFMHDIEYRANNYLGFKKYRL